MRASKIPAGAFTLTFYCNLPPIQTTRILDLMQEVAAWQVALAISHQEELANGKIHRDEPLSHLWDPQGLVKQTFEKIEKGDPIISCDFGLGQPMDPRTLLDSWGRWSEERFQHHLSTLYSFRFSSPNS